MSPNKLFRTVA